MSDQNELLRMLYGNEARLKQTEVKEVPPLYLPYAQRVVNPATTGGGTQAVGDFPQPWPVLHVAFYVSVFVVTTNNGTNFWTIELRDATNAVIASVTTAAASANTWTRLADTVITAPLTTNAVLSVVITPTLAPGNIYVVPSVAMIRTGT